jgi:hypothetical protein
VFDHYSNGQQLKCLTVTDQFIAGFVPLASSTCYLA